MKYLIAQPLGGLCNRMRVITGAAELAKALGKELVVIWTQDSTLNARFSDLFMPIPYRVIEVQLASLPQRILWHTLTKALGYRVLNDEWIKQNARGFAMEQWIDQIKDYNLLINANLDIILDGDYSIFRPSKKILPRLMNIDRENTIGIHIRRTDNENATRYSPTHLFFERIQQDIVQNPGICYYLATDDPHEEAAFEQEFGDRILIYKKESLDRNNPVAIRDAVVDLCNLSHCNKIYGSYYSSFSDTAALWSGIEKEEIKLPEC